MSHVGASGSKLRHAAVLALLVQSVAYCGARAQEMVVRQEPIPDSVWDEMQGKSWHDGIGCPSRAELVLLTVPYHDFQGQSQHGYLIVAANNTSAFNCRPVTAGLKPIAHMQGIAVDINPVQNLYVTGHPTSPMSVVKPEAGRPYIAEVNRSADIIGLITPRGVVTEAFSKRQWRWANSGYITDYKHFSQNGK